MRARLRHLALLAIMAAGALAAPAAAQTKLTFNKWLPGSHPFQTRVIEPWAQAVERETGGRVKFEFTASSLSPPQRQYDLVRSGAVDVVFTFVGYTPDRFPLTTMTGLPFLGDSAESVSVSFWDVFQRRLAAGGEFRGVKLLGIASGPPGQIFTSKPVRDVAGYKGQKIRSADPVLSQTIAALGAVPVFGPAPQSYEMLSGGVVDGGGFYYDSVVSFDIARFVPHVATHPGGLVNGAFFLAMNEAKWRQLSAEDRAAIEKVSGAAWAQAAGQALDELEVLAKKKLAEGGMTFVEPEPAFAAEVRRLTEPVEATWLKEAQAKASGTDPALALQELRQNARVYKRGS